MNEYIFTTIKNAIPPLTVGGITHIYPLTLPEGNNPDTFVTYNLLRNSQSFGICNAIYQLSVFSKDFTACNNLALELLGLFAHKTYLGSGDPVQTNSGQVVALPFDRESGYYSFAVDIIIISKKPIENYLQ